LAIGLHAIPQQTPSFPRTRGESILTFGGHSGESSAGWGGSNGPQVKMGDPQRSKKFDAHGQAGDFAQ